MNTPEPTPTHTKHGWLLSLRTVEKRVRNTVYRIVGNSADVNDIVQETYLRLFTIKDQQMRSHCGFMMTTAINLAIDLRRKKQRAPLVTDVSDLDELIDYQVDIERSCIASEELVRVARFSNTLPPRRRQAFILTQVLGYSYVETASKMNCSIEAIEGLIGVVNRGGWRERVVGFRGDRSNSE